MFVDHYEILQISPNADQQTIYRVYRIQAQRYHPDNQSTGNAQEFRRVSDAYQVLSDPARRTAYDVEHRNARRQSARDLFEQANASQGVDVEKQKRQQILSLLYKRRAAHPEQPSMSLRDFEEILAIPRQQLEFSIWFLKEGGHLTRSDSARHTITMKGAEWVEALEAGRPAPEPKLPGITDGSHAA